MGNCQAMDNINAAAAVIVQQAAADGNNGNQKQQMMYYYNQITANEIMKMHPGHFIALHLTTTTRTTINNHQHVKVNEEDHQNPTTTRVTRIKLLKATDTLVAGHVYRLLTKQEVKKGLWEKKNAKKKKQPVSQQLTIKEVAELELAIQRYQPVPLHPNNHQIQVAGNEEGLVVGSNNIVRAIERDREYSSRRGTGSKLRSNWLPSLHTISESSSSADN